MARVLCKRKDLYPYHLVVGSFKLNEIPANYVQMTYPILLRAKNISYENVTEILNHTGKTAILWDSQFIDYRWKYNRIWNEYPIFDGAKIISANALIPALLGITVITISGLKMMQVFL